VRFLFDIGHPGHVHLFKNLIYLLKKNNHQVCVISRDKEVTIGLLKKYGIEHFNRGKGYKGIVGKAIGMAVINGTIMRKAKAFKPDILIGGVGNVYIVQVAKLIGKPSIIFDDTEHAKLELGFIKNLATCVLTPDIFQKDLGANHLRYKGYHELAYLQKKYFDPDREIGKILGNNANEKYVVLRFVSWDASHDRGHKGLSLAEKFELVHLLESKMKVFISSESDLPHELKKYELRISPEKIHDVLANAELFIGEGATMASEAVCLGTPAIYINSLSVCYCTEQAQYGMLFHFKNSIGLKEKVTELLNIPDLKISMQPYYTALIRDKIQVTDFMFWFVENFPNSKTQIQKNPKLQFQFN
jgi:predicted glycosyltransferase